MTLGKFKGSSLKAFNCSTLWIKFIIQPYKPLLLGYAKYYQDLGTLLNTRASIVCYIFSEIVNKPLIPWSIYSTDLAIYVNKIVMY